MYAAELANLKVGQHATRAGASDQEQSVTQSQAGERYNVSVPSVKRAAVVLRKGVPELVQVVKDDRLHLTLAEKVVNKLGADQQRAIAAAEDPEEAATIALKALDAVPSAPPVPLTRAEPIVPPAPVVNQRPAVAVPAAPPPDTSAPPEGERRAPDVARDHLGRPLVGELERLVPVFEQREAVNVVNQSLGAFVAQLKDLDSSTAIGGFLKRQKRFVYNTEQIAEYLRLRLAPFCVCPCCDARGKKCPTCGAKGWIARAGFERLHPAAADKARSFSGESATAPDDTTADRAEWNSMEWAAGGCDSVGNTIPPRLRDDFACDDLLEDVRDLERIAFQMSEAKGYLHWLKPEAHDVLAQAVRYVKDSIPYAVCINCEGQGCAKCLMSGYHPKWSHDAGHNNTDGQAVATKAGGK